MAKQQTYAIGPVVGTGATKTGAKADAEHKAARWLTEVDRDVRFVIVGDEMSAIWSSGPDQWTVKNVMSGGIARRQVGCSLTDGPLEKIVRRTAYHLAQNVWDGSDRPHPEAEDMFTATEWADWKSWIRFQRRYQVARDAGFDDTDCHAYACEYGSLELLARIDALLAA